MNAGVEGGWVGDGRSYVPGAAELGGRHNKGLGAHEGSDSEDSDLLLVVVGGWVSE